MCDFKMTIFTQYKIQLLSSVFLFLFLSACGVDRRFAIPVTPSDDTLTPTITPLASITNLPIQPTAGSTSRNIPETPTIKCPRTILFYGDSRLGALGVSFLENIKDKIGPCYDLINASFWAHTAVWGAANLQDMVILKKPDAVALWWGANDFNGCNGTTDPTTDLPDKTRFNIHLTAYISALRNQIETLSGLGIPVYVFDEPRVNGGRLPWAFEDDNGNVTGYDHNHLCSWDWVSDAVTQAQKQLVIDERRSGNQVFLVDVWQLYMNDGALPGMYSEDVVHPGSLGRKEIAELFIKTFQDNSLP